MKTQTKLVVFVLLILCVVGTNVSKAQSNDQKKPNLMKGKGHSNGHVSFENGVAFLNKKAIYIDPAKLDYPSLYLSTELYKTKASKVIKNALVTFLSDSTMRLEDSNENGPEWVIQSSRRIFSYKIDQNKLWLREQRSDWCPVTIKYIGDVKEDGAAESPYFSCMALEIKTKWFQGVYKVQCQ